MHEFNSEKHSYTDAYGVGYYFDVYHSKCNCFERMECGKYERKLFKIYDPLNNDLINLWVCRYYIKDEIQKPFPNWHADTNAAKFLIEDIIISYFQSKYNFITQDRAFVRSQSDLLDRCIILELHNRPRVYGFIKASDAFYYLSHSDNVFVKSKLKEKLHHLILLFYEEKKDVKKYNRVIRIIGKAKKWSNNWTDEQLLKLIIEILETYDTPEKKQKGSLPLKTKPKRTTKTDIKKRNQFLKSLKKQSV